MVYIDSMSTNANFNFALEKYLMFELDIADEYFLFWRTSPTLMVGKFQNAIEEINMDFVKQNNINVVRRITGGGTIYTDMGGWQFSFITRNPNPDEIDFKHFTKPIIEALRNLGVNAYNSGRNDLLLYGKKFSGNAQFKTKEVNLHHGSLLFNTNLENLVRALNVADEKIISKGIKSVKERVTNISDYIAETMTSEEFKDYMLSYITKDMTTYKLTKKDLKHINQIKTEQFDTWEWNFGKSPKFNITKEKRCTGGLMIVRSYVDNGIIKDIHFYGDFFEQKDIEALKQALIGCRYEEADVKVALDNAQADEYFYHITKDDILGLII